MTRFTVEPALRPISAWPPDWIENWSIASIGSSVPAMPETPPWLTAAVFWNASLLSAPSIWKLLPRVRTPFTEVPATPGASCSMPRKSRPLSGRSCTCLGRTTLLSAVDTVSSSSVDAVTLIVSATCDSPIFSSTDAICETVTSTFVRSV